MGKKWHFKFSRLLMVFGLSVLLVGCCDDDDDEADSAATKSSAEKSGASGLSSSGIPGLPDGASMTMTPMGPVPVVEKDGKKVAVTPFGPMPIARPEGKTSTTDSTGPKEPTVTVTPVEPKTEDTKVDLEKAE